MSHAGRIPDRRSFLLCALLALDAALCLAAPPKWLPDAEAVFPSDKFIRAVGEGNSADGAKRSALAELSAYFVQTVSAETTARSSRRYDGTDAATAESVRRNVRTASQAELFSVQYTEVFYDRKAKSCSVCAYISRDEAWEVLSQKLSAVQNAFANGIALAESEAEPFRKIITMNRALSLEEEFSGLYEMALVVYPQKCAGYTKTAERIGLARQHAARLKKDVPVSVAVSGDYSQRIKAKIESLLSRNGFFLSQDGAYTLSAAVHAAQSQSGGIYSCEPYVEASIRGKNGTVASFAGEAEKFSAYNAQTLEKVTMAHLERMLEERFAAECLE